MNTGPLIDVLGGGQKDLRDLCRLIGSGAKLRGAIDRLLTLQEQERQKLFPVHASLLAEPRQVDWTTEDFMARSQITFLTSKPGAGKTTVIHAYCAAAEKGGLWLNRRVPPHRIVLVTEEGTISLGRKREKFGAFPHVRVHNLDMGDLPSENWDDRLRIIRDVAEGWGAQAIVLDTLFSFALCDNENDAAKVRPMLNRLRYLSRAGFSVLATFHDTKSGSWFAGSVSIQGQCDVALAIAPADNDEKDERKFTVVKNRLNEDTQGDEYRVTMDDTSFVLVEPPAPDGAPPPLKLKPSDHTMLAVLNQHGAGITATDWETACARDDVAQLSRLRALRKVAHTTFYRHLDLLVAHGYAALVDDRYQITVRGKEAVNSAQR